jgi:hypothetical protein
MIIKNKLYSRQIFHFETGRLCKVQFFFQKLLIPYSLVFTKAMHNIASLIWGMARISVRSENIRDSEGLKPFPSVLFSNSL